MPSTHPDTFAPPHLRRRLTRASAIALVLAGCREVRIDPAEQVDGTSSTGAAPATSTHTSGAGGAPTTTSAMSSGEGGGPGSGGAGGTSPYHDPVPGCEELAWVGEPVVIPIGPWPTPRLATLDDGNVGLIVADRGRYDAQALLGFVVEQPFATWPPSVSPPTVVLPAAQTGYHPGDFANEDPRLSARGDGTYAVSVPGQPTGTSGTFGAAPDGLVSEGELVLDPTAGGGAHRILWTEEGVVLDHFASVVAGATPTRLGELPPRGCWDARSLVTAGGTFLLALGAGPYCDGDTSLDIVRAGRDGIATVASLPVSGDVWHHELVPRPGGAWLLVVEPDHVTATSLAGDGAPTGAPWDGDREDAWGPIAATAWRDGFAFTEIAHVGDLYGARVRVSDGVHETTSLPFSDDGVSTRGLSVAASGDGRSLLVAHEVLLDLWIQRADCLSPAPPP